MLCPQCQSSGRATARIDGTKVILNFELMNMNPEEFAEYVEEHRNEGANVQWYSSSPPVLGEATAAPNKNGRAVRELKKGRNPKGRDFFLHHTVKTPAFLIPFAFLF